MTTLMPDAAHELAELRRRAYGPDAAAPLADDDLARLHELEEQVRRGRSPRVVEPPRQREEPLPDVAVVEAGRDPADVPPEAAEPVAPDEDATEEAPGALRATDDAAADDATPPGDTSSPDQATPAGSPAASRAWWRRRSIWIAGAVGLVVGVVTTLGIAALQEPPPDAVLGRAADQSRPPGEDFGLFGYLGLDLESVAVYEPWEGLDVWTAERADGATCLLVGGGQGFWDFGCAADDLDPQVDLHVFPGMENFVGEGLHAGSGIRFIARGSTVDVWVRPVDEGSIVFNDG